MNRTIFTLLFVVCFQSIFATDFYVSTSGNDASGTGTQGSPWRTLRFACTKVAANQGHTIRLTAGTFVELQMTVPTGVNIVGAGRDITIIKSNPSFYYNPASPGYSTNKLLINFESGAMTAGNQSIKDLTVDGDGKKLHGAIYVKNRTNVLIQGLKVQNTNFTGIWLFDVKDSRITDVQMKDCAWGSSAWSSGTIDLANLERVEIDHVSVDEGFGNGIKALGSNGQMHYVKVHDNNISVVPTGQWKTNAGTSAPNIAFELWNVDMKGCEFYNNYIDNVISLVMDLPQWSTPKGTSTIRLYNNVMDFGARAGGNGYAMEISLHDVEIDHNFINKGRHAITNWDTHGNKMSNWNIHHNVFYGIEDGYPAEIIRAQFSGLHNVKFYNNTVEFIGNKTANIVAVYGGNSENIEIKNNLFVNSTTGYNYYPNKLVHFEKGTMSNLQVSNNFLVNQAVGTVPGTYAGNITTGDPKITKTGNRPTPYYVPAAGSPLIDAGVNVGLPFTGGKPDIGAYETGATASIAVTAVSVAPATVTLVAGATSQLTKTISPANATNQTATWSSSNASVATVNSSGLVTAVAAGTATITATTADGGKKATSVVTVTAPTPVAVAGIGVGPTTLSLGLSETAQLSKTISPANATNQNVTWSSSNTGVAAVNSSGLVTGKAGGTATITATTADGNKKATSSITVSNTQPTTTELDNASQGTGTNQFNFSGSGWTHSTNTTDPYLKNTVSFSNATSNTVTLTFSGNKVELYAAKAMHHGIAAISVDNGPETFVDLFSATRQNFVSVYNSILANGNHTIKIRVTGTKNVASTGAYVVIDYIKIYSSGSSVAVTGVSVSPTTMALGAGSTYQLTSTVSPATATNKNVTWSSSNTSIATVNSSGLVTAVAGGSATITATTVDGTKTASCNFTVGVPVTSLSVTPATVPLNTGLTHQLVATVSPANTSNKNVTWTSSNTSIAIVSTAGLVTAVAPGSATITATTVDGAKKATSNVTIGSSITSVSISPATLSIDLGETHQLTATINPSTVTNKNVTWSCSNNAIATVSATGVVTALTGGNVVITATTVDGGKTGSTNVGIVIPVTGVTVSPQEVSLSTGATFNLQTVVSPSNATNKNMSWNSSNSNIATVSSNGVVTAVGAGDATITVTASDGGKISYAAINVKPQQNFIDLDDATIGTTLNQFKYTGTGWTNASNTSDSYFNRTCSHANTTNHYTTLTFSGNKVEFYSSKASHHGIAAVSIDGGAETTVDSYASSRQDNLKVFSSGVLSEGNHTIKIRVTGTKNAASIGSYVVIDYLKVYSSTAIAPTTTQFEPEPVIAEGLPGETQIYPNPIKSGDILNVTLTEATGVVTVIDVTGYAHFTASPASVNLEIPTTSMPKGMYFLQHRIGTSQVQYKILVD